MKSRWSTEAKASTSEHGQKGFFGWGKQRDRQRKSIPSWILNIKSVKLQKLGVPILVFIHWRTATNNLGKRFDPPPFWAMPKLTRFFFVWGFPYRSEFSAADQVFQMWLYPTSISPALTPNLTFVLICASSVRKNCGKVLLDALCDCALSSPWNKLTGLEDVLFWNSAD